MALSVEELQKVVYDFYNLSGAIIPLNGYDEANYLFTTPDGTRYILKATSGTGSIDSLHGQIAMMDHLGKRFDKGHFPEIIEVQNTDQKIGERNRQLITLDKNNHVYFIRLLSFIEGTFWHQHKEKPVELFESLGSFLGRMDRSLSDFSHPGLRRHLLWDISRAYEAVAKLHFITNPAKRRIADYFLLQFETEVLPKLHLLRHTFVHNDVNDHNVLVSGNEVCGLIDFGDAIYTAVINNLAIACTYAILGQDDPLVCAQYIVNGYHSQYALQETETDLLYYLIAARICISVTQSAYNASQNSDNEHHYLTEKPAWELLEKWIRINPLRAADAFRKVCGFEKLIDEVEDYSENLAERREVIGRNLSISYKRPLQIIKGALQYLYDDKGNTFVDCVNNVSHVGHCHPTVVRAMQQQIATLNTNTRYLSDNITDYAHALLATLPPRLKVCYFVNSGSEANDLAVRMARHYTRRHDVVVLDHAYHGTSTLTIEMSPYKFDSEGGGGQKPYIHKAVSPDLYRGPYQYDDDEAGVKYAESVKDILKTLEESQTPAAAFICETLLGVGGQIPLPAGYLKSVYEHVRNHGGVCIADEVQVGFGRVGEAFWGFELQDVEPDIVVMGKPMGNGHPLAAVVVTEEIADAFDNGLEYFNTFGGNPVSMVTGLSVLDVIIKENLQRNALETGNYLMERLRTLMLEFSIIGDVRGHGLFVGVELVKDRGTKEPAVDEINFIVEQMKESGFLLSTDGPMNNVLKIKPPMVFSQANADDLVTELRKALMQLAEKS